MASFNVQTAWIQEGLRKTAEIIFPAYVLALQSSLGAQIRTSGLLNRSSCLQLPASTSINGSPRTPEEAKAMRRRTSLPSRSSSSWMETRHGKQLKRQRLPPNNGSSHLLATCLTLRFIRFLSQPHSSSSLLSSLISDPRTSSPPGISTRPSPVSEPPSENLTLLSKRSCVALLVRYLLVTTKMRDRSMSRLQSVSSFSSF